MTIDDLLDSFMTAKKCSVFVSMENMELLNQLQIISLRL